MHQKIRWAAALTLGAAAWKFCRDRKYPLARGCPPLHLFVVPGVLLGPRTAALGNRVLARMPLPPVSPGLRRTRQTARGRDGRKVPLTVYEPVGAQGELPCLVGKRPDPLSDEEELEPGAVRIHSGTGAVLLDQEGLSLTGDTVALEGEITVNGQELEAYIQAIVYEVVASLF